VQQVNQPLCFRKEPSNDQFPRMNPDLRSLWFAENLDSWQRWLNIRMDLWKGLIFAIDRSAEIPDPVLSHKHSASYEPKSLHPMPWHYFIP
jgi:hypothetical protein